ncbi:MAG TPA: tetratricopeptide repeat protein [Saprospiraceae bacterium]|nr:tetratricopeptide repeat protein [Saprospiraceae bacterium]
MIDSLQVVLRTAPEDTSKVKTLNALSWYLRSAGEMIKARAYADTAIALAGRLDFKVGSATAYNVLALLDVSKGNYESALQNHNIAFKFNEEIGNKRGMATNFSNMGLVYWVQSNYPEALKKFTAALTLAEEIGDKRTIIGVYNNIGSIYGAQGNYPEALKNFLSTLKLAREVGDKYATAVSLKNVGSVYGYQGKSIEATEYFKEHLGLMEELGNKEGIAYAYDQIGATLEKQDKHDAALDTFLIALKLFEEIGERRSIALLHNHIGSVYIGMTNYPEALHSFQAALNVREELADKEGISESYGSIGRVYAKQAASLSPDEANEKYQESIVYTNKSLVLAKEVGYRAGIKGAYKQLTETYTSMGDYKNALKYQNLFIALKDSLLNNETTRKLEQLRTQFEVEKAVAEEKVQQEKLLAEQEFLSEKEHAELQVRHELGIAEAKAQEEKAIAVANLRYQMALEEARTEQEKQLAEQQFQSELKIAEENARHQLELGNEKAKQEQNDAEDREQAERERVERKRRNEIMLTALAILGIIALFVALLIRQRNLKRRAIEKAETVRKMAELELQSLRAQLNPHFMFNSLNAIQELILLEDNDKSHTYLARFSKLLRMLLENANSPFIPLARELEFLELYLSLENLRIPDLKYSIHTDPDIDTEKVRIPNMILQPYIENAIWHGLSHKKMGNRELQLRVQRQAEGVQYEIEDNGIGRKKAAELRSEYRKEHKSKGMELLTKRFRLLNEEYRFDIKTNVSDVLDHEEVAGTLVTIHAPWEIVQEYEQSA